MPAANTLAVFGGSFNPPHVAHQMACVYVAATQPVDAVVVVPCFRHPFDKELAPFADRLEMCRLALAALPGVEVSSIEEELGGEASRTLVTLEALAARRPGVALRLVIGSDILPERHKWWRWDAIERLAPPIVLARAGHPVSPRPLLAPVEVALPAVSSSEIRGRLRRGEPVEGLLPRAVLDYVRERGLYR